MTGVHRFGGLTERRCRMCATVQVRASRGRLLDAMRGMQGHAHFPSALVKALDGKIGTWLEPIYGWTRAEEEAGRSACVACACASRGGACCPSSSHPNPLMCLGPRAQLPWHVPLLLAVQVAVRQRREWRGAH